MMQNVHSRERERERARARERERERQKATGAQERGMHAGFVPQMPRYASSTRRLQPLSPPRVLIVVSTKITAHALLLLV